MPRPPRERTVEIDDPDDPGTVWRFDLRFLLSHYHCIWGQGCRSVRGDGSSQGCCSHGVYVEGADWGDEDRGEGAEVDARAAMLTPERVAEPRRRRPPRRLAARARAGQHPHARPPRRVHLLQPRRPPRGPGLRAAPGGDRAAARIRATGSRAPAGRCRCTSSTTRSARRWTVRAVRRSDWGSPGAIDWWCTSAAIAQTAERPVWQTMEPELRRTCGDGGLRPARPRLPRGRPSGRLSPCRAGRTACAGTRPTCRRSSARAA